jgi:ATP-dependent DNA ligase
LGLEGTILKKPRSIWKNGTSKDCYKLKLKAEVDVLVTGWNKGSGRNADTFGSLKCVSSDGLLEVDVNGRGDEMREKGADFYMGKVITIECNGIQLNEDKKHSLFLPIFIEVRDDKDTANSLEEIKDIFDNLING